MADSETFHRGDHFVAAEGSTITAANSTTSTSTATTTSFSQLLFSNDDDVDDGVVGLDVGHHHQHHHAFQYPSKPPKMLCFGGNHHSIEAGDHQALLFSTTEAAGIISNVPPQKPGVTCRSDPSSSASSSAYNANNHYYNHLNVNSSSKSCRKRNGSSQDPVQSISNSAKPPMPNQRSNKKTKMENTAPIGHAKVRKEKLGERVAALQQLVSPFGKTDTASVLHEAMGYIRFLQDQVQVLCSPYIHHLTEEGETGGGELTRRDLRSRGLCLVPVECTVHVASSNGADYWSPAAMGSRFTSSTRQ